MPRSAVTIRQRPRPWRLTGRALWWRHRRQELDHDKIDDAVLALLRLTLHDERRAWKGFDWDVLDRLHRKGLIANPVGKAKSVVLTDEGLERSAALLEVLFAKNQSGG